LSEKNERDEILKSDLYKRMGDYRRFLAETLLRVLQHRQDARSLILGCGDLPIDGDALRTDMNRTAAGVQVVLNAASLPFEDGMFDAIIATEVIEHVPKPHRFMDEVCRVLKPNGILLLTTPNAAHLLSRLAMITGAFIEDRTMHQDSVDHLHFFDRDYLLRQLKQRFASVLEAHRYLTLPGFRYIETKRLLGLCYQLAFVCSGPRNHVRGA